MNEARVEPNLFELCLARRLKNVNSRAYLSSFSIKKHEKEPRRMKLININKL